MNKTGISWTNFTWNPLTGCSKISEGCDHCYAEELYNRHRWSFSPSVRVERFKEVLRVPSGSKVFVGSVTDIFHDYFMKNQKDSLDILFDTIEHRPDVTFQILTKRPWSASQYFSVGSGHHVPGNVWIGTTVENRRWLERIRWLKNIDAKVKFLSCEPLLENITIQSPLENDTIDEYLNGIDWVIVGAESGRNHRAFSEQWAQHLLEACRRNNVAFFYKQGSDFRPGQHAELNGVTYHEFPDVCIQVRRF